MEYDHDDDAYEEESASDTVRVVLRVRPFVQRERDRGVVAVTTVSGKSVTVSEPSGAACESLISQQGWSPKASLGVKARGCASHTFSFDCVYDEGTSQREVFESTARPVVESCLEGYNATIFAYGQTGTGKTYTMDGNARVREERGIIPRSIEQIFAHVSRHASNRTRFLVRASCIQIYQEVVSDLLADGTNAAHCAKAPFSPNSTATRVEGCSGPLAIREDPKRGVYVDGLSERVLRPRSFLDLYSFD